MPRTWAATILSIGCKKWEQIDLELKTDCTKHKDEAGQTSDDQLEDDY